LTIWLAGGISGGRAVLDPQEPKKTQETPDITSSQNNQKPYGCATAARAAINPSVKEKKKKKKNLHLLA
jgi:hypothetical protein